MQSLGNYLARILMDGKAEEDKNEETMLKNLKESWLYI